MLGEGEECKGDLWLTVSDVAEGEDKEWKHSLMCMQMSVTKQYVFHLPFVKFLMLPA